MYPGQRFEWVATPPPGADPTPAHGFRLPYLGPPAYRTPPRWGFPALAWRRPTSVAGGPAEPPVERVRSRARLAVSALWVVAVVAGIAAGAEIWRYGLLLASRTGALSRDAVQISDSLVVTGSVLSLAGGLIAAATCLWWIGSARRVATESAGYLPARPDWHLLPGLLIPGVNLVVPGAVLAELEHAVLRRSAEQRPRPSALLKSWWITWAGAGVLCAVTIAWRFRDSVQAQADGVLLSAATDLAAAAVAVLTARVVTRLTTLLAPIEPSSVRLLRVIRVQGAPEAARAERPATAAR
ncbi:DUF4328 domain-containing protein [Actinokineospora auranticolor]|uniref:Uncharacterized protein DUF4328 n=1 Tax=Actinokineospora auranticolor TaxID=155976 RepID=A0A2S6GCG5_9PSEU|nr:DUF4328 domain-containing protein [Actinokineospora auranticolor]PPK61758.1 uncharacterized protein DUF4328 [Actinokineospora auranticolor]